MQFPLPTPVSMLSSIVECVPVRCGLTLKMGSGENHWQLRLSGPTLLALIADLIILKPNYPNHPQ